MGCYALSTILYPPLEDPRIDVHQCCAPTRGKETGVRLVCKVQQKVKVTVLDVDLGKKRISLSMKAGPAKGRGPADKSR